MNKYDIAVVGGGMVGAAVAIGFAKQGRKVVVIEGFEPKAFEASQPMDIRVSAISHNSVRLLESLGAWQHIQATRVCPYKRLETWDHPECRTRFHSDELNLEQLGYIVENRLIQLGLWQEFAQYSNLTLQCPDKL
ncbi:TPA: FAD-dependent monooxygenase, partial [Vibrio vulnificus]|nr:FAD-dependent monooxygenase [Vibrio vulnificus]